MNNSNFENVEKIGLIIYAKYKVLKVKCDYINIMNVIWGDI